MKILRVLCALLAVALIACEEPDYGTSGDITIASLGTPEDNEIWFVTTDGRELLSLDERAFDVPIEDIIYGDGGINIIRFAGRVTAIGEEAFSYCHNIFNLSLPNSIVEIDARAFFDCKNMECLTLGAGLRDCGTDAFDGCYNLYSLHIPSIQNWCRIEFDSKLANPLYYAETLIIGNSKISELNIPEGTEEISDYAFVSYYNLRSVNIPASLRSIGRDAFDGCDNINKVDVKSVKLWCSIEFESELSNPLSIADKLYHNGVEVSTLELTSVNEVHNYAFINCKSLISLVTDDTLTSIGTDSFRNCTSLAKVELGSAIGSIGKQAFMNCQALKSVTCLAQTPPMLGNNDVFSYNNENRKFYVPSNAITAYTADERWSRYADVIEAVN